MSWRDRPYSGEGGGPRSPFGWSGSSNPLSWAPSIGSLFGIRVEVHILFLFFIAIELLRGASQGILWWETRYMAILFGIVLLHEFGHCFGARYMGGHADHILMWPLGGLASVAPPHRPWAHFFTAAAGPLVNVVICLIAGTVLAVWAGTAAAVPLNPFHAIPHRSVWALFDTALFFWVYQIFYVSYILLLFNACLPIYPFDGGRLFQASLWYWIGYRRSMLLSTLVGMIGSVLLGCYGLYTQSFLLIGIGVFGYLTSMQQRQMAMAMSEFEEPFYEPKGTHTRIARWRQGAWARKQKRLADEQAEVDRILQKVHDQGLNSLTPSERKTLSRATQRQRERERELHRVDRL